jgi:hypothetical protein
MRHGQSIHQRSSRGKFMRPILALFAFALLAATSTAGAQATRTWVSGVGDDANPCSRTAPCKTWAGAISKTAASGEIDALDPGGFGALTITKAITIDGGNGNTAGVLVSGTNGIVVSAGTGDAVILRNIDFNGLAPAPGAGVSGVSLIQAGSLQIENSVIYGFGANNYASVNLTVASGNTTEVSLRNVRISSCVGAAGVNAGGGLSPGTLHVTLDDVRISNCGIALAAADGATVFARNSDFSHNATGGVAVTSTTLAALLSLDHVNITQNGTGVAANGTLATVRLSDTSVLDNTTGLSPSNGAAIISFTNNRLKGNTTDGAPTLNLYQR